MIQIIYLLITLVTKSLLIFYLTIYLFIILYILVVVHVKKFGFRVPYLETMSAYFHFQDRPKGGLTPLKSVFAHDHPPIDTLEQAVKEIKPTAIIGIVCKFSEINSNDIKLLKPGNLLHPSLHPKSHIYCFNVFLALNYMSLFHCYLMFLVFL